MNLCVCREKRVYLQHKIIPSSMPQFTHLHVHSHYSMLDGMSKIPDLVNKARRDGMYAMALTDHGNMFGIKDFLDTVAKENGKVKNRIKELEAQIKETEELYTNTDVPEGTPKLSELQEELEKVKGQIFKPIVGTEAYCARRSLYDKDKNLKEINPETGRDRIVDSSGYHLILLAKNLKGYHSLTHRPRGAETVPRRAHLLFGLPRRRDTAAHHERRLGRRRAGGAMVQGGVRRRLLYRAHAPQDRQAQCQLPDLRAAGAGEPRAD